MITCHKQHLLARCLHRGYTLSEVAACIASQDGDILVVDESHAAYPRAPKPGFVPPAPPPPPPSSGPGTELKQMLQRWLGIKATPTCPCNARAAQMDAWGPDECERRLEEIVDWLGEEAARRKLPFVRLAARKMVQVAIGRARKAAAERSSGDINP